MSEEKRNLFLDFLKGIACIGVVFIHVTFPGKFGEIISYLARFAVPMFFMISGYYAYDNSLEVLLKKVKHIIRITLYALWVYASWTILTQKNELLELLRYPSYWVKMIVLGNFDVFVAFHLWFLVALIYAYLFLYLILKKDMYTFAVKSIPLLFLLRIVVCIIVETNGITWYARNNFLISALPYLLLGNYIAYNKGIIKKYSDITLILTAVLGAIGGMVNVIGEWRINLAEIGVTFYSVALFVLAIKNPRISLYNKIENLGKKYSLYVYIIHLIVLDIVEKFFGWYSKEKIWYGYVFPIIVLAVTIFVSCIIQKLTLEKQKGGKLC